MNGYRPIHERLTYAPRAVPRRRRWTWAQVLDVVGAVLACFALLVCSVFLAFVAYVAWVWL